MAIASSHTPYTSLFTPVRSRCFRLSSTVAAAQAMSGAETGKGHAGVKVTKRYRDPDGRGVDGNRQRR